MRKMGNKFLSLALVILVMCLALPVSTASAAQYAISASTLVPFADMVVGYTPPAAKIVTITNIGTGNVTLNALPTVANWTLAPDTNWTAEMAPGQTRAFTIQPNSGLAAGTYNPTITITGTGDTSVNVSASFTVVATTISATPTTPISFGHMVVGYTPPTAQTVTIENTSTVAVTLTQPTATNYDIGTLSRTDLTTSGPNRTATFTVRPKAALPAGTHNETITITGTGGASATVSVRFIVAASPVYTINASQLQPFDSRLPSYTPPAAQTVTITNTGTESITLNLPTATNYDIGTLSPTTLAAYGARATFTVRPKAGLGIGPYNETINITGSGGANASVSASFTVSNASPVITRHPHNSTVTAGSWATFNVVATGPEETYQWQRSNDGGATWSNVGANFASYSFTAQMSDNGAQFRVQVSNRNGVTPVISNAAVLTVTERGGRSTSGGGCSTMGAFGALVLALLSLIKRRK